MMENDGLLKLKTHVPDLDEILGGGLCPPPSCRVMPGSFSGQGVVIIIKGKPGTGKTTLAMQLAIGAMRWGILGGIVYHSLEQGKESIEERLKSIIGQIQGNETEEYDKLGKKQRKRREKDHKEILELKPADIRVEPGARENGPPDAPFPVKSDPMNQVIKLTELYKKDLQNKEKMILIDAINVIKFKEREYLDLNSLVECLRKNALVSVLIYEPAEKEYDDIDYLSDMIIDMKVRADPDYPNLILNMLSITKSRYQFSADGWHQYKFFNEGIKVFPSLYRLMEAERKQKFRFYLSSFKTMGSIKPNNMKNTIFGFANDTEENRNEAILVRMLHQIKRGSCTVILGPRRTAKSLLTMDFLRAGAKMGEPGLLLSFLDNSQTILSEKKCINVHCDNRKGKCTNCFNTGVHVYYWPSECITASELLFYVKKRIDNSKIKRLLFWDLTQLDFRFPLLANDKMFLPAFIELMKKRKITTLIMGSGKTLLTNSASAVADNVIFCWRDKVKEPIKQEQNMRSNPAQSGSPGVEPPAGNTAPVGEAPQSPKDDANARRVEIGAEVVAVYIDRIEGEIDPEKKKMYCLPVKQKKEEGKDDGKDDGKAVSLLNDSSYLVTKFILENPIEHLMNAEEEIRRIEDLQGLPK